MAVSPFSSNMSVEEFQLDAETELRFVVADKSHVVLELKRGLAEVFGTELLPEVKYTFQSNANVAVFTWRGCTVALTGKTESCNVVKETPMVIFVNVHAALEQMRQNAEEKCTKGPTVLVAGPTDVGKSTLCRLLLNYAVRQGRKPVLIDLDIGQGQISVPGTIGALTVEEPAGVVDGFFQHTPLVYHYGHKSPGHNLAFYNMLVTRLASVVNNRAGRNPEASVSGIIINTCGWVKCEGYRALTNAALAFEVDIILAIGHERMYHELSKDVPAFVKVVYIPKCTGAIERTREIRVEARETRVREYFYGLTTPLHPHSFDVEFSDLRIYKVVNRQQLPVNIVPGTAFKDHGVCLLPMTIGFNMLNHLLTVTFASSVDEDVINTNVAGFICITRIDVAQRKITILSPQPPPLPRSILLYSDVTFSEEY